MGDLESKFDPSDQLERVPKYGISESRPKTTQQMEELRVFVGRNADYYLRKWLPTLQGADEGPGFNLAAVFLSGFWLPYRKMYKVTFIFFGIIILETILEEVIFVGVMGAPEAPGYLSSIVGLLAGAVCGTFGNRWYLSHARKMISEVRASGLQSDALSHAIAKRGGVSIFASLGLFSLLLISLFLTLMIIDTTFNQARFGSVIRVNRNDEVYYAEGATEAEARILAETLTEIGFFGQPNGSSVKLTSKNGPYVISFVVIQGAWHDPSALTFFRELGEGLADDHFGYPLTIELCNEYLETQNSFRIE